MQISEWFSHPDYLQYAAQLGNLIELQYLYENGCPWDEYACRTSAENGHIECLKYLHQNGSLGHDDICRAPAEK